MTDEGKQKRHVHFTTDAPVIINPVGFRVLYYSRTTTMTSVITARTKKDRSMMLISVQSANGFLERSRSGQQRRRTICLPIGVVLVVCDSSFRLFVPLQIQRRLHSILFPIDSVLDSISFP